MKRTVGIAILVFCSGLVFAQAEISPNPGQQPRRSRDDGTSSFDKIYFGGGMGFSSGVNAYSQKYTFLGLYPIVGYKVTPDFSTGASFTFQWYDYPDVNQTVTQYGISPFVRYNFSPMFAYSEFMILNTPTYDPGAPRRVYNRWLVGLGYSQPLGTRSAINVMGLYDVLYDAGARVFNSPWVFRVFFSF